MSKGTSVVGLCLRLVTCGLGTYLFGEKRSLRTSSARGLQVAQPQPHRHVIRQDWLASMLFPCSLFVLPIILDALY